MASIPERGDIFLEILAIDGVVSVQENRVFSGFRLGFARKGSVFEQRHRISVVKVYTRSYSSVNYP